MNIVPSLSYGITTQHNTMQFLLSSTLSSRGLVDFDQKLKENKVFACGKYTMEMLLKVVQLVKPVCLSSCAAIRATKVQEN